MGETPSCPTTFRQYVTALKLASMAWPSSPGPARSPRKGVGSGSGGVHVISPRPMGAAGQSLAAPAPIHHPPSISMTKTLQSPTAHPSESDVEASKTSFFKDFCKEGTRGKGGKVRGIFKTFLPSQPPRPSIGSWLLDLDKFNPAAPHFSHPQKEHPPPKAVNWEVENPTSLLCPELPLPVSPNLSWGDGLGQLDEVCYLGPNG